MGRWVWPGQRPRSPYRVPSSLGPSGNVQLWAARTGTKCMPALQVQADGLKKDLKQFFLLVSISMLNSRVFTDFMSMASPPRRPPPVLAAAVYVEAAPPLSPDCRMLPPCPIKKSPASPPPLSSAYLPACHIPPRGTRTTQGCWTWP